MKNELDLIIFDLETTGLCEKTQDAIEIAAVAYNARTLEPYPAERGVFYSLMKPVFPDNIDDGALKVNGKTREEIMAAPDQGVVFNSFVRWVGSFNKKKNQKHAPIACGKNIRAFDLLWIDEMVRRHCKGKTVIFNSRRQIDLEDFVFYWFEDDPDPDLENEKMDTLRKYFGLSLDGAHQAMTDTLQTAELIIRFLKLHRNLRAAKTKEGAPYINLKNACKK